MCSKAEDFFHAQLERPADIGFYLVRLFPYSTMGPDFLKKANSFSNPTVDASQFLIRAEEFFVWLENGVLAN